MGNSGSSRRRTNTSSQPVAANDQQEQGPSQRPQSQPGQQVVPYPAQNPAYQYSHPPNGGYPGSYATPPGPPPGSLGRAGPVPYPGGPYAPMAGGPHAPPPPQYYGQVPWVPSNGHFHMSMRPPMPPYVGPPAYPPPPTPPQLPEPQKSDTIRNFANLKKMTLKLEKDEANPGFWLLSFSFDSSLPGSACIFFAAKEGNRCGLTAQHPKIAPGLRFSFENNLGQKYRVPSGRGVPLDQFQPSQLAQEGPSGVYPLLIRLQTVPEGPPTDAPAPDETPGAELPTWVQVQTTYATIEKKDDAGYQVKVLKQKIWNRGQSYELQEIYGIEQGSGSSVEGGDSGKECVICMSEPRDTTVLPCRHMCMCSGCAKVLRYQTNRCPICRSVVDSLLEISLEKKSPLSSPVPGGRTDAARLQGGLRDSGSKAKS